MKKQKFYHSKKEVSDFVRYTIDKDNSVCI